MSGPIARNTLKTSAMLGLRLVVQAATLLLVTRILGPNDFGIFAGIAALAVTLGALSPFGMHLIVLGRAARDHAESAEVLRYAIPTTLGIGAIMFAAYVAIVHVAFDPAASWWPVVALVGVAELLLQPLLALPACRLQGAERITTGLLLQNAPLLIRMIAIGLIAMLGVADPLLAYAWFYMLSPVLVLAALFLLPGARVFDDVGTLRWPRRGELGEASGFAAIGVSNAAPGEIDKALALRLLAADAAGMYSASARVIGALTLPVTAMILSALPRLFRESHAGAGSPLLLRMFTAAGGYGLLLAIALALGAPLVGMLFGSEYHAMPDILRGLAWAVPGITLRQSAGAVLMSVGRPWMRVGYEIAGVVVLGIAASLLAPRFGLQGMVVGLVIAEWSMFAIGITCILRVRATDAGTQNATQS